VPPSVINLVSPDLVPPSPPSGAQANPIDAETDQVSEGKHRRRANGRSPWIEPYYAPWCAQLASPIARA